MEMSSSLDFICRVCSFGLRGLAFLLHVSWIPVLALSDSDGVGSFDSNISVDSDITRRFSFRIGFGFSAFMECLPFFAIIATMEGLPFIVSGISDLSIMEDSFVESFSI